MTQNGRTGISGPAAKSYKEKFFYLALLFFLPLSSKSAVVSKSTAIAAIATAYHVYTP